MSDTKVEIDDLPITLLVDTEKTIDYMTRLSYTVSSSLDIPEDKVRKVLLSDMRIPIDLILLYAKNYNGEVEGDKFDYYVEKVISVMNEFNRVLPVSKFASSSFNIVEITEDIIEEVAGWQKLVLEILNRKLAVQGLKAEPVFEYEEILKHGECVIKMGDRIVDGGTYIGCLFGMNYLESILDFDEEMPLYMHPSYYDLYRFYNTPDKKDKGVNNE